MTGIYKITNIINGKSYIGQSVHVERRYEEHTSLLSKNKHYNSYLQRAWNKYGEENFQWQVLSLCGKEQLDIMELHFINLLQPEYNNKGGGNSLHSHTTETKVKIGLASKGNKHNLGRKHTNEWKERMSKQRKGFKHSEETRKTLSLMKLGNKSNLGKSFSKDWKDKIGKANSVKIRCLNDNMIFSSMTEASNYYKISTSGISLVCSKKQSSTKGYMFEYV